MGETSIELGRGQGPLSGVKVVEVAGIGPGPHACMIFADLGADVVRLERPGGGSMASGSTVNSEGNGFKVFQAMPWPRVTILLATSRPTRKPPRQAISHILKYLRAVSSRMLHGTLAPMLKTKTSIGAMSRSMVSTTWITSSSWRASEAKPCAWPPPATISSISGCSLSALRRVAQAIKPSRANRLAMAPPVASPAPMMRAAFFVASVVIFVLDVLNNDRYGNERYATLPILSS